MLSLLVYNSRAEEVVSIKIPEKQINIFICSSITLYLQHRNARSSQSRRQLRFDFPLLMNDSQLRFFELCNAGSGIISVMDTTIITKIIVFGALVLALALYHYLYR